MNVENYDYLGKSGKNNPATLQLDYDIYFIRFIQNARTKEKELAKILIIN